MPDSPKGRGGWRPFPCGHRAAAGLWLALLVGLVGLAATLVLYDMLISRESELIDAAVRARGDEFMEAVETRVGNNLESVDSLAGFFAASKFVSWQEFRIFGETLLPHRPGVHSLQWLPRVGAEQREAHETTPMEEDPYLAEWAGPPPDIEEYAIRDPADGELVEALERLEYFPIYYIIPDEPLLWGMDMAAIPTARHAMVEAMQTGEVTTTAPIRENLVWVLRHIEREGDVPEDPEMKAVEPLDGFLAAAFRTDRAFDAVLAWMWPADMGVEVWDETASPPVLLYHRAVEEPARPRTWRDPPALGTADVLDVGRRRWRIETKASEAQVAAYRSPGPVAVLAGGSAISLLLAAFVANILDQAQRAREEAAERATRARQQAAVARLGLTALGEAELGNLMQRTCEVVADTLEMDYAEVLELDSDGKQLRLRAQVGLEGLQPGVATAPADASTQGGYTLRVDQPVVVNDLASETRFTAPLLRDFEVVSGLNVVIHGEQKQFGVLGVQSRTRRAFSENDIAFVQAVANVLGQVVVQRRIHHELRESERRFRTMADAAPVLIWLCTPDRQCEYFNRRWLDFTGRSIEEELGEGWLDNVHPDDRAAIDEVCEHFDEERPFRLQYRLRRHDGLYRWMLHHAAPRFLSEAFVGYIGSAIDITDQKRAEQQLRSMNETLEQRVTERTATLKQTNQELERQIAERRRAEERLQASAAALERSNNELRQFAYIASHDLQEPLRKIEGFGDMLVARLEATGAADAEARNYISRMMSAAKRMRALINGLLAYSRVATHVQPFERVNLEQVAREVVDDLEFQIRDADATVVVEHLPTVEADALQMRQLLQNLIGNAIKFRKEDEPPRVHVSGERSDGERAGGASARESSEVAVATRPAEAEVAAPSRCRIYVRDNGIGIDQKYRDRLFQPFQRPLHPRGRYEGTGMGLAICRKIVEAHGGQIDIDSTPGEGTTFIVTLPCGTRGEREGQA